MSAKLDTPVIVSVSICYITDAQRIWDEGEKRRQMDELMENVSVVARFSDFWMEKYLALKRAYVCRFVCITY